MEENHEKLGRMVEHFNQKSSNAQKTLINKPAVDLDEYNRRLRGARVKEQRLLQKQRVERIQAAKNRWKELIDDRWKDAELSKIEDAEVSSKIQDLINRHRNPQGHHATSLVISGDLGKGKTYLGYIYAYELINEGILGPDNFYIETEGALAGISRSGFEKKDLMAGLKHPKNKFYFIDDVGRGGFANEYDRTEIWYDLINHIYVKKLTLVVTTNLILNPEAKESLRGWLGAAATDRLTHITPPSGKVVLLGDNMRKRKGEEWERNYVRRNATT